MCVDGRAIDNLEKSFASFEMQPATGRTENILEKASVEVAALGERLGEVRGSGEVGGGQDLTEKRVQLIEKKVKLLY